MASRCEHMHACAHANPHKPVQEHAQQYRGSERDRVKAELRQNADHATRQISLLYGLQEQGEAYLLPTLRLHGHRCPVNQS